MMLFSGPLKQISKAPKTAGIYLIEHVNKKRRYVGSANNFYRRAKL